MTDKEEWIEDNHRLRIENGRLRAALVELKCHLYAQDAMTDGEIIAACRAIADRALVNKEGK